MENGKTAEFRIIIDGDLSDSARKEIEGALNRTALEQAARLDLTKVGPSSGINPDFRLNPEWFGIWIRRDMALQAAQIRDIAGQRQF